MFRYTLKLIAAICLLTMLISSPTWAKSTTQRKPNFLFILVDDLGQRDVGFMGSTFYETPNIDKFSTSGMTFTSGYAACPVCSPTRASILTGKHPARLNITDWIPGYNPQNQKLIGPKDIHQLPLQEVTIAETLKTNGYKTFYAGKWHLGSTGFLPEDQGFDINKGGHHRGSPPGGYYAPYKNPKLTSGPKGEYLTERLTAETIQFINDNKDKPFLAYLAYYNVHTPIQPYKKRIEHFKQKADALPDDGQPAQRPEHEGFNKQRQDNPAFASMVSAVDISVGQLLDELDKLNLTDNTIVIFFSDNGGLSTLGKRGRPTSNLPLRAGKGWCYEGGIREPMIIRAPGITKPGTTSDVPVISMDFYPTMLQLANIPLMPTQHADGTSLVPLLKGKPTIKHEPLFWHFPHYHGSAWKPGAAIRDGDWKLIEFYHYEKVELYNLKNDIGEQHDLSKTNPKKTKELLGKLHNWQKNIGAQLPTPNPKYRQK